MSPRSNLLPPKPEEIAEVFRISTWQAQTQWLTFNQYLIRDSEPHLSHTAPCMLFQNLRDAIERVIPVATLRYVRALARFQSVDRSIGSSLRRRTLCPSAAKSR
jgi:hypothetical protein